MYDDIQVDCFFPIYVWITNRKFSTVPSEYFNQKAIELPRSKIFPDKEEKVISVYLVVCLEQEVSDKEVSPVSGVVVHWELSNLAIAVKILPSPEIDLF